MSAAQPSPGVALALWLTGVACALLLVVALVLLVGSAWAGEWITFGVALFLSGFPLGGLVLSTAGLRAGVAQ